MSGDWAAKERPLSIFDMFRLGIGPSSSHTVGPMRAGKHFSQVLAGLAGNPTRVTIELFGSLGATGRGHHTDRAVMLGLGGYSPADVPGQVVDGIEKATSQSGRLKLAGGKVVSFVAERDIHYLPGRILAHHVNALTITARDEMSAIMLKRTYYSIGGGFVQVQTGGDEDAPEVQSLPGEEPPPTRPGPAPYPFTTGAQLLQLCQTSGLSIAQIVRANEEAFRERKVVDAHLDAVEAAMFAAITAGWEAEGVLPGGLQVPRRAPALAARLGQRDGAPARGDAWAGSTDDPLRAMDWVNLYALAVNEENAAGHRIVTAPTNGAAGVVPAVLRYLEYYCPEAAGEAKKRAVHDFLLAATAVGALIKLNASIAGAEVGCQGEVGSASAMAAAGLAQALGGTPAQVENAAEVAMEHNLGLTCDPVGGLVQIPCIERNAIAAVKAINSARMALWGDGTHSVSLDAVIETMRQTGVDMLSKYKETSVGGLAVNVVEC